MSNWKLVRLNFGRSPAHFGEVGIGLETTSERVHSDTLFSAWVSAYARLFGKTAIENLLKQFESSSEQPPFHISSTFVYRQHGQKYIYYLPKPLVFPKNYPQDKDDLSFAKTYKKLSYLPLEIWQRWYQGAGFTVGDRDELIAETQGKPNLSGSLSKAGTFEYSKAFAIYQTPKVAVDRTTRATNFYHTGFVQFACQPDEMSGLYFLLNVQPELEHHLHAALEFLGEEGIGGERSSGAGRFELEWLELPDGWKKVVDHRDSTHYSLISLFWEQPLSENLLAEGASYTIQERGGWIASPFSGQQLRRKMVRMFAEGSVFPVKPVGRLAPVTPEGFNAHSIYRSGLAFSLPVTLQR